jgi:hypothetical protein
MRNIGGSVGIALMTTFLARRTQVHQNHLIANVTAGSAQTERLLQGLRANFYAHGIDGVTASRKALGAIYGMVQQHAAMLAFVEAFWVMGVVFLLMLPFLPLLQYSKLSRSPRAAEAGQRLIPSASDAEIESSFRERAVPSISPRQMPAWKKIISCLTAEPLFSPREVGRSIFRVRLGTLT